MSIYTACSLANLYIIPVLEICHVMELYNNCLMHKTVCNKYNAQFSLVSQAIRNIPRGAHARV